MKMTIYPPTFVIITLSLSHKSLTLIDSKMKEIKLNIDLLLLHQPFGDVLGAWKDMEKAVELGKVKSIGLSNFEEYHFEDIMENAKIKPVLMQVECHPYYQQVELKEKLDKYDIVIPGAHNSDYIKENINVFDF